MNDKFILGAGQSHHLEYAFRRGDWDTDEVNRLGSGDVLREVREVVNGFSKIEPIAYTFDAAVFPTPPEFMMVHRHKQQARVSVLYRRYDELYFNGQRIILKDVRIEAKSGKYTIEHMLTEPCVLNATVMQYLANMPTGFIPWPNYAQTIYFPGSIFVEEGVRTYIGSLDWREGRWKADYREADYIDLVYLSSRIAVLES